MHAPTYKIDEIDDDDDNLGFGDYVDNPNC